ncbi:MAG: hypothetical protein JEZ11_25710 [Desulfobacterales bacterium]|nr:hypothetical protein [Desulfobacterales bacterium]
MAWSIKTLRFLPVLALSSVLIFAGCDGSNPHEQIDDTVKELSGQKSVERMGQMKQDIGAIQDQQEDRLKKLDDSKD